jgi:hypothetical protein
MSGTGKSIFTEEEVSVDLMGEPVARIYTSTPAENITPVIRPESNKAVKNLDWGSIRKQGANIVMHSTETG